MRVLLVGPFPPPHGGVETNLVAIRELLRRTGHECRVINITRHRREDADGVFFPKTPGELVRLLWTLPADIVHLHFGGHLSPRLLGLTFCSTLLPGRKTVLTFHSGGYPSSPAGKAAKRATLRGFVMRRLDGAIAVNAELAALYRRFGIPDRRIRTIVPFSIQPPDPASPLPERVANFMATHRPALFTVGQLEPEYDVPLQVDALEDVLRQHPAAGLLVAGSGSREQEIREHIASKPYRDRILLYGDMTHAVTLRTMLDCTALLRPTHYDGDSISVREALYLGTPVIASDNGMRPAGVRLVPPRDRARLAAAILEVVATAPARRQAVGSGQENIEAVVEFYRELLKR